MKNRKFIPMIWIQLMLIVFWSSVSQANSPHESEIFPKLAIIELDEKYVQSIGGFPAKNRMDYLPLIAEVKINKPKVIYLDFHFAREANKEEGQFAFEINKLQKIFTAATYVHGSCTSNDTLEKLLAMRKIQAFRVEQYDFHSYEICAVAAPYSAFLAESNGVLISSPAVNSYGEPKFYLHAYLNGYVVPTAAVSLLNEYLRPMGFEFEFRHNYTSIAFGKIRKDRLIKNPFLWAHHAELSQIPQYPIHHAAIPVYSASDILSRKKQIPNGALVIIGTHRNVAGQLVKVGHFESSSAEFLGQQINVLWNQVKDYLPTKDD